MTSLKARCELFRVVKVSALRALRIGAREITQLYTLERREGTEVGLCIF